MIVCVNCGIELDEGLKICPLCGKPHGNNDRKENITNNCPSEIILLQKKENKKHLWELSGIIAFSGIAICTIVDLVIGKGMNWSLLSDISILALWIILTLFLFTYKKTLVIISLLITTILLALFLIDLVIAGPNWFLPVALPVTVSAFIVAGIIIILYRAAHFKGLNIIAAAFIILAGFCIIVEMILDKYLSGFVTLRWSLIVAVSILPIALVFSFYYYRLKKGNRLDSFFHI
jgi:hypothetical protein